MQRTIWLLSILFLFPIDAHSFRFQTAQSTTSSDEFKVCSSNSPECKEVSCLDQCLEEGEDPIECSSYCTMEVKNDSVPSLKFHNFKLTPLDGNRLSSR